MLPDGVRLEPASGGLDRLVIDAAEGTAHVYLHGAQVTHFQPKGARPVLFLSQESRFETGTPGKAIRGGIPVCFPWFGPNTGDATAPTHGFARLLGWELGDVTRDNRGRVRASLHLGDSEYTRRLFPHEFAAVLAITVDARIHLELTVRNAGPAPMIVEEVLHSYFAVGDARRVSIRGLEGVPYIDKAQASARKAGEPGPISIASETDRVYGGTHRAVTIEDPVWARRIIVQKAGSGTTVVWNPWIEKAKATADFGDDEWTEMVCVETANAAEDAVPIASGETHTMSATIEVR